MLNDFVDAYIDYLGGLLSGEDIDVTIVRETLRSLGFDGATVEDILGDALHMCPTTLSPCSSDLYRASCQTSSVSPEVVAELSFGGGESSDAVPPRMDLSRRAVDEHIKQQLHDVSRHVSESPSSVYKEGTCEGHHRIPSYWPDEMRRKPHVLSPPVLEGWNVMSLSHRRSSCYRRHLQALEKLLGIVWTRTGDDDDDDDEIMPLEIRSLLCRQRLEMCLRGDYGTKQTSLRQPHQKTTSDSEHLVDAHDAANHREGRRKGQCTSFCKIHSHCNRRHRSLQAGRVSCHTTSYRRQCEFCASLEDRFLSSRRGERSVQPQITPFAVANACGVKMHDRVVNTVGCGRIKVSAVATTLSQREDRVRKALAYRQGWNAVEFLGRRINTLRDLRHSF